MEPKLYIGASEVVSKEEVSGGLKVTLSDGTVEYLTEAQFDLVASETPYADGDLSMRKWKPTINAILQLLLDANMQMNDKEWVMQRVDESLVENFRSAVAKKFGVSTMQNIGMKQIDEILKA